MTVLLILVIRTSIHVNHSNNEFVINNKNHINSIESFWGYVKYRLYKFKGISKGLNYILKKVNIDLITKDKIYIRFCRNHLV